MLFGFVEEGFSKHAIFKKYIKNNLKN